MFYFGENKNDNTEFSDIFAKCRKKLPILRKYMDNVRTESHPNGNSVISFRLNFQYIKFVYRYIFDINNNNNKSKFITFTLNLKISVAQNEKLKEV